jgi:hypothetical protein
VIRRLAQRWADAQLRKHNELLHDRWIRGQQRIKFLADQLELRERELSTCRTVLSIHKQASTERLAMIDDLRVQIKTLVEEA